MTERYSLPTQGHGEYAKVLRVINPMLGGILSSDAQA